MALFFSSALVSRHLDRMLGPCFYLCSLLAVSIVGNGIAAAITRASAVTMVSRRSVKLLDLSERTAPPFGSCRLPPISSGASDLTKPGLLACIQGPLGIQNAVKLDELGHQPGPTGLMAGA